MTATTYMRGHPIAYDGDAWRYADTGTPADDSRPCVRCGITVPPGAPDPCLGTLPGVRSACCGHGVAPSYVLPAETP